LPPRSTMEASMRTLWSVAVFGLVPILIGPRRVVRLEC
jgi:hypothetical protein